MENEKTIKRPVFAKDIEAIPKDNVEEIEKMIRQRSYDELVEYIKYLQSARAFYREDRLKLQILDNVDFTIWACDEDFIIRLWEGSCEKVYSIPKDEAIEHNYLELIVDPLERYQSKVDALDIIRNGAKQSFRLCDDHDGRGFPIQVITQCCRIEDDEERKIKGTEDNSRFLQAEMAINMNYKDLLYVSKQFIKRQNEFNKELEKERTECLQVLKRCRDRVLEAADYRINQYYHICSTDGTTYTTAEDAITKIIECRSQYLNDYNVEVKRITDEPCFCDLTSTKYTRVQYTFNNNHSFSCVYRQNRNEIVKWRKKIEENEVKCQKMIAKVQLSNK